MNETIQKYGEWGFRAIALILLILNLWAKQNFVTLEQYGKDREHAQRTVDEMQLAITSMDKAVSLLSRQDRQIEDHEIRLRALERIK